MHQGTSALTTPLMRARSSNSRPMASKKAPPWKQVSGSIEGDVIVEYEPFVQLRPLRSEPCVRLTDLVKSSAVRSSKVRAPETALLPVGRRPVLV